MKRHLTIILTLLSTSIFGQIQFLNIEKVSAGEEFHFPIIYSPDKRVEEKINVHLQLAELELIKGKEKKNIFEIVSNNNGTIYGGKVSMAYEVLANTERNLSIIFYQESCGMTCGYWTRYHNFNPRNGDRYALKDFFSHSNFIIFKNFIIPIRQAKIKRQIEEQKKEGEEIEHLEEYIYSYIAEDNLNDFYFTSDFLYFINENLLNRHDKNWDLDHITEIPIESIKHLLNDFGKAALISGNNLKHFRSVTEPQLYEGTIDNRSRFYILFRNTFENNFDATYAYKKFGRGISLEGKGEKNIYSFKELDEQFDEVANLVFEKDNEFLTGYWQGKEGKKLPLNARRK